MATKSIKGKKVIILGAGGHAKVLFECAALAGAKVLGFLDNEKKSSSYPKGFPKVLGGDDYLKKVSPKQVFLANGVGSVKNLETRKKIYEMGTKLGFTFATVVHPKAIVSRHAALEDGVQVFAGAIIQAGSEIGSNTIINTGAIVDHDCKIGRHVHIATGAVLSGGITIGDESHIGTGAVIKQGVRIGKGCVVGAGSAVIEDVVDGQTVVGVPAKPRKNS